MNLDERKARVLDAALEQYVEELRAAGEANAAVTLAYTHSLHRSWRAALQMLPLPPGMVGARRGLGAGRPRL